MKKELLILFFLMITIFISGCSVTDTSQTPPPPEYKDESLKMEIDVTGKADIIASGNAMRILIINAPPDNNR